MNMATTAMLLLRANSLHSAVWASMELLTSWGVWGPDKTGGSGPVRDIIKRLRRKLGDDANNPTYVLNEPRVGYSMAKVAGYEETLQ